MGTYKLTTQIDRDKAETDPVQASQTTHAHMSHASGADKPAVSKQLGDRAPRRACPKGSTSSRLALIATFIGAALLLASLMLAFLYAPLVKGVPVAQPALIGGEFVSTKLLFSQKIFFYHVPVAICSFVLLACGAGFGLAYLLNKDEKRAVALDQRAQACVWAALVFIIMTMVSGVLWTRFEWGLWWVWEPRLTTYFILMMLVIAYWVLRSALSDSQKQARLCAAFSILIFLDAPLSFFITRLTPSSIHPVVLTSKSSLPPAILIPFLLALVGMLCIAYALSFMKYELISQEYRLQELKDEFEARRLALSSHTKE